MKEKSSSVCANSEEKKAITSRINRISGQLKGIQKMISEGASCNDVLIQLSAAENSIKSLSNQLLDNYLHSCLCEKFKTEQQEELEELIYLFKRFNKG